MSEIAPRVTPDLGASLIGFFQAVQAADSVEQVASQFAAAILQVGMTASASGMVSGPKSLSDNIFHFVNWPPEWLAVYQARGFDKKDPAPRWAIISGLPVSWSEVVIGLPANDAGHEVAETASEYGFTEGFITPVRASDGSLGLVSVGGPRKRLDEPERAFLQAVSNAAFHRAEALSGPGTLSSTASLFSRRERECVSLLNQGFTDREIGAVLGVAESTARFHLDNARRKVGAKSRSQLVVLAATLQ
jgi:DNA-binding CsgD family transcriptional regulator